jgi:hypothetical protein
LIILCFWCRSIWIWYSSIHLATDRLLILSVSGIAAAACRDFTVLRNVIASSTVFSGNINARPSNCPPTAFLRTWDPDWAKGIFQPEFVRGAVQWLIGVDKGESNTLRFGIGALGSESGGIGLGEGEGRKVNGAKLMVEDGSVVLKKDGGNVIWRVRGTFS